MLERSHTYLRFVINDSRRFEVFRCTDVRMQLKKSTHAISLVPSVFLLRCGFSSMEEYLRSIFTLKVNRCLTYLRMQARYLENLLDVVYVTKCLKVRKNLWSIVLTIILLNLTTQLLACFEL